MMKKHLKNLILLVASAGLFASITPTMTANAKTKYYTNPYTLRHHKYWYSYQQDYNGNWNYSRLHFAKHSVFFATKTNRKGNWHHSHIRAKYYFVRKHNGWYTFGTRNSDDVYHVKPSWRYMNNHKHWTLGEFNPSNNDGGYQINPPYTVWSYTTFMTKDGWYYTLNHLPNF